MLLSTKMATLDAESRFIGLKKFQVIKLLTVWETDLSLSESAWIMIEMVLDNLTRTISDLPYSRNPIPKTLKRIPVSGIHALRCSRLYMLHSHC